MKRLRSIVLLFALQPQLVLLAVETTRPNIVIILADDLGIGDLGVYGGAMIATPNIDALAASGVRCNAGYVSHPVCSPSRAGLLTGRNQARHGWMFNPAGRDRRAGLSLGERTIANEMHDLGYATGMVGKWHLGQQKSYHPMNRGFDEYFGILEGGSTYIDSRVDGVQNGATGRRQPTVRPNKVLRGFAEVKVERYLTDVFTDEALAFIERHQDEPFMLYLSHITPHTPLQTTKKYYDQNSHIEDQSTRVYASMVSSLDESVRRVVQKLKETGNYENTLVVFLSDNGCAGYIGCCSNAPYRGFKRYHHEGGIRIPYLVSWPAKLAAGKIYEAPVSSLDLMATFTAAGGKQKTTEDSVNLLPFLTGDVAAVPHEYLYWRAGPTIAIRDSRWKLIQYNKTSFANADLLPDGRLQPPDGGWSTDSPHGQLTLLYDLQNDVGEQNNVADQNPEIVERLMTEHASWAEPTLEVDPILPPVRSTLAEFDGVTVQLMF